MPVRQPFLRTIFAALCGALALGACAPRIEPAGPFLSPPQLKDDRIVAADEAILPLRRWMPDRPPRAVILALHGFNDYSRAFERPGKYWTKKRIATYAYDQRGFGEAPHRGIWAGHETMAADAAAALDLVRARHPGVPVYVLGESMGGAIAMIAAPTLQADGLVLVAPALRGRRQLGLLASAALWLTARIVPWYPLTAEGLNVQASDNVGMLRALGRDPLIIKRTRIDAVEGLVNAMDAALAAAPRLPSLVLFGARDELVPAEPALALFRRTRARVVLYRDGWHMLLRDLNAQVALDDIAAWIADSAAPLPSDALRRHRFRRKPGGGRSRFGPGSFAMSPDARFERRADRDAPVDSGAPVRRNPRRPRNGDRPRCARAARSRANARGANADRQVLSFRKTKAADGLFRKARLSPTAAARNADGSAETKPRCARSRTPNAGDSRPRPALRRVAKLLRAGTQLAKEARPAAFGRVVGTVGQQPPAARSSAAWRSFSGGRRAAASSNRKTAAAARSGKSRADRRKFRLDADSAASPILKAERTPFLTSARILAIRAKYNNIYNLLPPERTPLPATATPPDAWRPRPLRLPASEDKATFERTKRDGYGEDARRPLNGRPQTKIRRAFARLRQRRTKVDSRLRSTTDRQRFSTTSGRGPKSRTHLPIRFPPRNCQSARGTDERRFGFARPFAADAPLFCRKKFPDKASKRPLTSDSGLR